MSRRPLKGFMAFVLALAGLAVARRGLGIGAIAVILFGVVVNLGGVYWVDKF